LSIMPEVVIGHPFSAFNLDSRLRGNNGDVIIILKLSIITVINHHFGGSLTIVSQNSSIDFVTSMN